MSTQFESFRNIFESALESHIQNRKDDTELELRIGEFRDKTFNANIANMEVFRKLIKYLKDKYKVTETYQLDVSLSDKKYAGYRVRLEGMENVTNYCNMENLDRVRYEIQEKKRETNSDIKNYNLRIRSSAETKPDKAKENSFSDELRRDQNKVYRYKKRYSFTSGGLRYDLTVVKHSEGDSFIKSRVLDKDEHYEIEIEFLDNKFHTADIYEILKLYNESYEVISNEEKNKILSQYNKLTGAKNLFVGVNLVSMHIDAIRPDRDGKILLTDMMMTPKADGVRHLLYHENGMVYLININMKVKAVGEYKGLDGTLYDCEVVNDNVLLFDTFFYKGENVTNKKMDERISLFYEANVNGLSIAGKTYYKYDKTSDNPLIINNYGELVKEMKYPLDGLIFTPDKPYPLRKTVKDEIVWREQLKWKPMESLSIDFLVLVEKDKKGKDKIFTDKYGLSYKNIKLFSGDRYGGLIKHGRHFSRFSAGNPFAQGIHDTCRMYLNTADGTIKTVEDGHLIYDWLVIEFIWSGKLPTGTPPYGGKWIPLRFRPDKTIQNAPNNIKVAKDIWYLICNPITEEMLMGVVPIPHEYYANVRKDIKVLTKNMRSFHNDIKRQLYFKVGEATKKKTKDLVLLDLACGKGGDMFKWKGIFGEVIGIDENEGNLVEARRRYKSSKEKDMPKVQWLRGDVSRNIGNGDVWLDNEQRIEIQKSAYDVISCNFAIHYFFKEESTLRGLLKNVQDRLVSGGYFIVTTFFGYKVEEFLKDGDRSGSVGDIVIWSINKRYNKEDKNIFGKEITLYNSSISTKGTYIPEWIVDVEYLVKLAEEYDLELDEIKEFDEIYEDRYNLSDAEKEYSFLNGYLIFKHR
jgi:hypothetical protein